MLRTATKRMFGRPTASREAPPHRRRRSCCAERRVHIGRRNPLRLVPESDQPARPMMRRAARLHSHQAARQRSEETQQLASPHRARHDRRALRVDAANLENVLGDVEPDDRNRRQILDRLAHARLPSDGFVTTTILARLMPSGRRPPHHCNPQMTRKNKQFALRNDAPGPDWRSRPRSGWRLARGAENPYYPPQLLRSSGTLGPTVASRSDMFAKTLAIVGTVAAVLAAGYTVLEYYRPSVSAGRDGTGTSRDDTKWGTSQPNALIKQKSVGNDSPNIVGNGNVIIHGR